ncbi:MAG: DUF554 domain-containing protein [Bacteroidota bacterium]
MNKLPIGTFVNMATVIGGGLIGLMLQQVFPDSIQSIVLQAVGLGVLIIGLQMSLKMQESMMIIFILSLMLGGIIGESLGIKSFLDLCELWIRNNFQVGQPRFSESLIAAFILFCASPITIVGAIEEGFQNKRELLLIKSVLDGVTAIAIASSYGGIGVLVSVIPMLFIQGGLTLLAGKAKPLFTKAIISQISGVGGVILIALSIKLLGMAEIFVANLIPAFLVCILFTWGYTRLKLKV